MNFGEIQTFIHTQKLKYTKHSTLEPSSLTDGIYDHTLCYGSAMNGNELQPSRGAGYLFSHL